MITFKQFLSESAPSPNNVDDKFNVGDVPFDNRKGLGTTSLTQNVMYRGAVAWIKPSVFRELATPADRSGTAKEIEELIRKGESIAAPWLDIDIIGEPDDPQEIRVTGHEGRARSDAFKAINGDVPMPVQLHPIEIRARHLSPEFFKWIEENGMTAQRSTRNVKLNATMYYWNGQQIKV